MNPNHEIKGLYLITDNLHQPLDQFLANIRLTINGGARIFQFRCKNEEPDKKKSYAKALLKICHEFNCTLIINDDVILTKEIRAHGVHLGATDSSVISAREYLGYNFIIGSSCYNDVDLAAKTKDQGADYVAFGCFYPSTTKPEASPANLETLANAKQRIAGPIVAIGGITEHNGATLLKNGADVLAVSHAVFKSTNPTKTCQQFTKLFTTQI